jgi:uncharacterized protein (TIGR02145 family)
MKNLKTILILLTIAGLSAMVMMGCKKEKHVTHVILDKSNITLTVGDTAPLTATMYPTDAINQAVTWTSSHPAIVGVASASSHPAVVGEICSVITAKEVGTATITVITEDGRLMAHCIVTVISTGLEEKGVVINGIKWATRNVDEPGAFANKSTDAGMFYQWNSKVGWSTTDPMVNSDGTTIWTTNDTEEDTWEKTNDPCPKGWRVPTTDELVSLLTADNEWMLKDDVCGRIFGTGDNKMFLPAPGLRSHTDGTLNDVGSDGVYWSNMASSCENASSLLFNSEHLYVTGRTISSGFSVRCVSE